MGLHRDPSSLSSLQQLLEELEYLVFLESSRGGSPWISIARLRQLFCKKYGVSLEDAAQARGYSDSLRSLLASSKQFSIYSTSIPQKFYVALLQVVVPDHGQLPTKPIEERSKRPWKVDENLQRRPKTESVEEALFHKSKELSEYQPILVPEIKSVDELEGVLVEIIRSLTINQPKQFVTVATLSKKFRDHYEQPIRAVVRTVCPDIKLIELIQTIPNLHTQKIDDDWHITLKPPLAE